MIKYETNKFLVEEKNGNLIGQEKEHEVLKDDEIVLIQKLGKGNDLDKSVSDAFDKIKAETVIKKGDLVAIKINLGGGRVRIYNFESFANTFLFFKKILLNQVKMNSK